ncbi:MAG: precorrin-2 C(20)-methyltransferase [Trichlorobacter sp.]|nr:precorrin-2 C(20)-methyltransferase [Trichlorobacter sp.]
MNYFEKAQPGHFYAVGVGPGAPDLVTLRAARLVETADLIIAPRSSKASESLAVTAIRPLLCGQELIENSYPMERDQEATRHCWGEMADLVVQRCRQGQAVVQITIGEPLFYSTSAYLLEALANRMSADTIHLVPGISAMQAAAACFGDPLTMQDDRLMLMPAVRLDEVAKALEQCETVVLYKVGPRLKALTGLLAQKGLLDRARLVCHVEQEGREVIVSRLTDDLPDAMGYMSTVIVQLGRKGWE